MTQETRRGLRFSFFAVVVACAAAGSIAWTWRLQVRGPDYLLPLMLVLWLVSESLAVVIPDGGSISLSYPLAVATILTLGPGYAAVVALASNAPYLFARPRSSWNRFLFNASQIVLSVAIPAIVFALMHGAVPGTGSPLTVAPLVIVATLGIVVNFVLSGVARNILSGESARLVWTRLFSWMSPSQLVLGFVGIAIAVIIRAVGGLGLALFVLPLIVARQTYQRSVRLREAYADTIRSLVAALEAKDVYTKGHSVRVAEYAVAIAEAMGFSQDHVRRVEQAALLHDLGKVGVSRRVLAKEANLTDGEYEEIKRHPDIGAHIVADVPYLADLVPMIEHHHERFDGHGYGGGIAGAAIPIEARILAVADSYDAMTSVRPYRGAMTHEAALRELRDNADTQFDPAVVVAFERGCDRFRQATMVESILAAQPDEG
jgi:putative nucleotidyltransferase with HDIG domain